MRKTLYLLSLLLCTLFSVKPLQVKANNAAAGELIYEWISDSTYRFYFKLYRDCSGNTEPSSVPLCLYNPCNKSQSYSTTMNKYTGPTKVAIGCSLMKNQCDSAASTIPGYQEVVYSTTTTLPGRCNSWKMYTYVDYRNGAINISTPGTTRLYAEVRFNNTGNLQGNSSPYPTIKPLVFTYQGRFSQYNNGMVDPDGDSLYTQVIRVLTHTGSCGDTTPANVTYTTPTAPAISIPGNPIQTKNSFILSSNTGSSTFTPYDLGKQNLLYKVSEYRNGVFVGSITREVQVVPFGNPPAAPTIKNMTGTIVGGAIQACAGKPVTFSFDIVSSDTTTMLTAFDNLSQTIPGANITYTNKKSDSVHATFNWTPGGTSTGGTLGFIVVVADSTCRPPGAVAYFPFSFNIQVWPQVISAIPDTFICLGDSIDIGAGSTGSFTWSVLSGSAGSLSCTTCPIPRAYPTVNSKYAVVLTNANFCSPFYDTVTVNVSSNFTKPVVTITANPGTNVVAGTPVTIAASVTGCANPKYIWRVNGAVVGGSTGTYTSTLFKNLDEITCELVCNDTCPRPKDTISNKLIMQVTTGIEKYDEIKEFSIYPNPNSGSFILKASLPGVVNCNMQVVDAIGRIIYRKDLGLKAGELNENIKLDVSPGMYLLKLNNEVKRFSIE